jgi:hypothetical protein
MSTGVKRYVLFHQKRHPREMGLPEVAAFLTDLAVEQQVAASTLVIGGILIASLSIAVYRSKLRLDVFGPDIFDTTCVIVESLVFGCVAVEERAVDAF